MRQPDFESSSRSDGLDIRSKMTLFLIVVVWSFLFQHPLIHLVLCVVIIVVGIHGGMTRHQLTGGISTLLPLLMLMVLFAGFNGRFHQVSNRDVLFNITADLGITRGGLLLGLAFGIRLINMVLATKILLYRSSLDDFVQLCHQLRLPVTVSIVITTAIRFFPELEKKRQLIMEAQRARGAEINESGYIRGLYLRVSLMIPLIINAIIMAEKLTLGLLIRGFGHQTHRTEIQSHRLTRKDYVTLLFCFVFLIAGLALRLGLGLGVL